MNATAISVDGLIQRGIAEYQAGRLASAEVACRQILSADPAHAPGLHLMGLIALKTRHFDLGAQLVSRAILADRFEANYHLTLGVILSALSRLEEAERSVRIALRLRPDSADAQNTLGHVLVTRCRPTEAESAYREALRLRPNFPEALSCLGYVLFDQRRLQEAEVSQREALRLQPHFPGALNGLAMVLSEQRRFNEAEETWRELQRQQPDDADGHHNRGIALLLTGRLAEGWQEYEWRERVPSLARYTNKITEPRWLGDPLGDRVLLVHAEQGLGDTLQFCRYASLLIGARVIFEVQPPLRRLLSRLPGIAEVIAQGDERPSFDVHCPLLSLPGLFGTTLETIPADIPYVTADAAEVESWRERLAALPGLRVGLVWAGQSRAGMPGFSTMDSRRSLDLTALAPLSDVEGVSFVSLQLGPASLRAASPPAGMALADFTAELTDMAATAALVEALDLVISVDTAVAHLAGALGKPVWLLNRIDTCWRWLLNRDDSPWYPTLRQFRQTSPGDWQRVIRRVKDALQRLAGGDESQLTPKPASLTVDLSVPELFQRALRHHEAGRVQHAEADCCLILAAVPHHAEALHLASVIARQLGRPAEAANLARRAIAADTANPNYHRLLGLILVDLGRHADAEASYRTALRLKSDYPEAFNGLAVALLTLGRTAEAEASLHTALRLRPESPDAFNNLAVSLETRGCHEDAVVNCEKALALRPEFPDALNTLGSAKFSLGRLAEAEGHYRTAVKLRPDFASAHNNLGNALAAAHRYVDAEASYREALRINPGFIDALAALSKALVPLGRHEEAEQGFLVVLRQRREDVGSMVGLGNALFNSGRYAEAEVHYRNALRLDPNHLDALGNLGRVLSTVDRFEEADASYSTLLSLRPDLGEAHSNRAMARLRAGKFAEGWEEFEWRWKSWYLGPRARNFAAPLWNGEPLAGRVLLLYAEQGLGDTLQFCRYAPLAVGAARVILEVPPPLLRLLSRLPGIDQVIARGQELPSFDLQCPLMSLPRAFGTTLESIPADTPYLTADPAEVGTWRERVTSLPGLRVGLVWAGSPRAEVPELGIIDARRSLALATLAPLARVPGVSFVSLQKGSAAAQASHPPAGMTLTDFTAELHDMAATAALIETLDLIISVDTSVAHLAGALGKPVWLLNRFDSCWRWLTKGDDCRWYPTMRQFRQPTPGDWKSVIERVADGMRQFTDNPEMAVR